MKFCRSWFKRLPENLRNTLLIQEGDILCLSLFQKVLGSCRWNFGDTFYPKICMSTLTTLCCSRFFKIRKMKFCKKVIPYRIFATSAGDATVSTLIIFKNTLIGAEICIFANRKDLCYRRRISYSYKNI